MINTSKFVNVKDSIPQCICTLDRENCLYTDKVDNEAQKNLGPASSINLTQSSSHSPKSLINCVSNLEISPGKITMGHGEYIVFHKLLSGEKKQLSPETFEKVYKILIQYSPAALINKRAEKANEECANRYELIKAKLKEIDPTLEVVFVPKTLYELIFIRKCIREDLKHQGICSFLGPRRTIQDFNGDQQKYEYFLELSEALQKERKCWHLCYFIDAGDNENAKLKDVIYRLNKAIFKSFNLSNEGFTHQEFSVLAEKEIEFLKDHYKKGLETTEKRCKGEIVKEISSCSRPGPTTNFAFETTRGVIKPMGIRHENDAQIIRNALALDCSKVAQTSFFLYRGADFQKDSTSCWSDKDIPYSLSYGSSLFAGCLYDGGATAFHYMRNQQNAYAIPVPFNQLNDSPFYIPSTHTMAQLFGCGEIFHARTKVWKDFDIQKIGGMNLGENGHLRDHLKSNLNQNELTEQFINYKNHAIQLK